MIALFNVSPERLRRTYKLFSPQTGPAQPESPTSINISLCASKCIRWSLLVRERIFQYLRSVFGVSHEHKLCLAAFCPTSLPPAAHPPPPLFTPPTPRDLRRDCKARVFKGRSILKRQGGGAPAAKEHDSGFGKHWSVRRNGCASNLCEQTACVFLSSQDSSFLHF